jgi:hypothetical protein
MRMLTPARTSLVLAAVLLGSASLFCAPAPAAPINRKAPKRPEISAKILAAKSVYFDNETGFPVVGADTLRELKKWGRFQVVENQDQAQLVLVLSGEEFNGDVFSPAKGDFEPEKLRLPRKPLNAFLTVIDPPTGDRLWIDSRPWGGLLTGENSAGRRLIDRLRKRVDARTPR